MPKHKPFVWMLLLLGLVTLALWPTRASANTNAISGTVTDIIGSPLAGIEVSVYRSTANGWDYLTFMNTDGNGQYAFADLADGTYRLLFRDWSQVYAFEYYENASRLENGTDIPLSGGTAVTIDADLELAGRISGTIIDVDGNPVQYPMVVVFAAGTSESEPLFVQQPLGATYDIGGLPTDDYIIRVTGQVDGNYYGEFYDNATEFNEGDPIPVTAGFTTGGIDIVLGDDTGGAISGRVTNLGGTAVAGIEVSLYRLQNNQWQYADYTTSDAAGEYQFTELPSDTYRLGYRDYGGTYGFQYFIDAITLETAVDIVVANAPVSLPDVILKPAAHITGTVTDPAGNPLQNSLVFVFVAEPERGNVLFLTDANDGTYDIGGLAAGDYILQFAGTQAGGDHQMEYYDDVGTYEDATPVSVLPGQTVQGIDAIMGDPPGGTISGDITNLYGRAFDFARAHAYVFDGTNWVLTRTVETTYYESAYEIDLPPGAYRLQFEGGSFLAPDYPASEYYDDAPNLAAAQTVTVTLDGLISGIDGQLGNYAPGSISGQVTDESGTPLPGIEVYIYDRSLFPLYDQTAVTDANGQYTIDRLWGEEYRLEFYDPLAVYQGEWYDDAPDAASATPVLVTDTAVSGIDAQLSQAPPGSLPGSISGQVTDDAGQPLLGIRVSADAPDGDWAGTAYTNSSGDYRLRSLAATTYTVRFRSPIGAYVGEWYDDVPTQDLATPVPVLTGTTTANINAALTSAGGIAGTVTNPFGNPYSLLIVTAYTYDGQAWVAAGSDTDVYGDGSYEINELPTGTYRVGFYGSSITGGGSQTEFYDDVANIDDGTDVAVTAGQITPGIDAVLGSGPSGAISGTVTAPDGTPVAGIIIDLFDVDFSPANRQAVTDANGQYTLDLLYNGIYYVGFSDPQATYPDEYYNDAPSLNYATPILIDGVPVTGINAILDGGNGGPGGGQITGTVTAEDNSLPLAGMTVRCYDTDNLPVTNCQSSTGADGTYALGGFLPAGSYFVRFSDPNGAYATEWFDDALTAATAVSITVDLGITTGPVDAALATAGALSGTVTKPDGAAFDVTSIAAYRQQGADWVYVADAFLLDETAYELRGLPPGTYRVRFAAGPLINPNRYVEYFDDAPDLPSATDVTVTAGQTTGNISAVLGSLQPGGITGIVSDESGQPLAGIQVTLYDSDGFTEQTLTADDGRYLFEDLWPDNYRLRFWDPLANYLPEYYDDQPDLISATPISVSDALVSGIDAALTAPASLSGLVTDLAGDPLDLVQVTRYQFDGTSWQPVETVFANPAGQYAFADLPPGSYRIGFVGYRLNDDPDNPFDMYQEFYDNAPTVDTAVDIPLAAGTAVTDIDAQLGDVMPSVTGGMTGQLTDETGQPAAGVDVALYWQDETGLWWPLGHTMTGADGRYTLHGVLDSHYRLCFAQVSTAYDMVCYEDAPSLAEADTIAIHNGTTLTDLDGTLTGRSEPPPPSPFAIFLPLLAQAQP